MVSGKAFADEGGCAPFPRRERDAPAEDVHYEIERTQKRAGPFRQTDYAQEGFQSEA
jgi:hypothetical protein